MAVMSVFMYHLLAGAKQRWYLIADQVRATRSAYLATQRVNCASVSGKEPLGPARFGINGDLPY